MSQRIDWQSNIQNSFSFLSRRDSLTAGCTFTRLPIAKGFICCQFASAQLNIRSRLLYSKLEWLEGCSLMSPVTEWLLCAHAATAPSVNFIIWLRVLDNDRSANRGDWMKGLWAFSCKIIFDLAVIFNVQMVFGNLLIALFGVCWFYYPRLSFYVLHFAQEESNWPHQHNY